MNNHEYMKNHDCPFEAFITNLGMYTEGRLNGEWVKFPTTEEKLKEVFKRIGIGAKNKFGIEYEEWFITDYACYVDGLKESLGELENLDELNYLASRLDEMDENEYEHFLSAMQIGDYTSSVKDIINLTYNLDNYEIFSEVEDEYDLGRLCLLELSGKEVPEYLENYIDYTAYGRDVTFNTHGFFTEQGYVFYNGGSFEEYYKEDIPDEYRVLPMKEEKNILAERNVDNFCRNINNPWQRQGR